MQTTDGHANGTARASGNANGLGAQGTPGFQLHVDGDGRAGQNGAGNVVRRAPTPLPPSPSGSGNAALGAEAAPSASSLSLGAGQTSTSTSSASPSFSHTTPPMHNTTTTTTTNTTTTYTPNRPSLSHSRSSSLDRAHALASIELPGVPPLDPTDTPWDTNTLALLLPHQSLFAPEALSLLRDAFAAYGTLAHWAPVRAMGRVIIVYTDDSAAEMAKREGDGLALHVDLDEPRSNNGEGERQVSTAGEQRPAERSERSYFSHRRKNSHHGIVLRVYALPRTSLTKEKDHLRPPEAERNFLISPPGSPPEGWEPIAEDGPNMAPLADDLRRALEALQLTTSRSRGARGGPEVILVEGGVRVEVEDTERSHEGGDDEDEDAGWYAGPDREWGQEEVQSGGAGIWSMGTQSQPAVPSFGFGFDSGSGGGLGRGPLTPSGRIMPTARPPMPTD